MESAGALQRIVREALRAEQEQRWDSAIDHYRMAWKRLPTDHRLPTNLGNVYWLAGQPDDAVAAYLEALKLDPQAAVPLRGLGNALRDLNQFEQADAAYRRSLRLMDDPVTAWNHSQLLLGLEQYTSAFLAAERRLELEAMLPYRHPPYSTLHPSLVGKASGRPLHLWSEQGFGDTLQYLRWLVPLCQRPQAIILEVEHQLVGLLQQGLAWLPYPPRVLSKPRDGSSPEPTNADQAPLMSLPQRLGGAPHGELVPYLRCSSWVKTEPLSHREVPRIGVVWAAGRKLDDPFTAREYQRRSLGMGPLRRLLEGLAGQGAQLTLLQVGNDRDMGLEAARQARGLWQWADLLAEDADFAATAAVVGQLDLVITVDTAMAHLAGALGHPAWVLLPWSADPRWLRQRHDSVWYPSLRLWRQQQRDDWSGVVDAVLKALPNGWQGLNCYGPG